MLGKYVIDIKSKLINYTLELERSITIIKGCSGTGKTTLIDMLKAFERKKISNIKVSVTNNAQLHVIKDEDDLYSIDRYSGSNVILFMDEEFGYAVKDNRFLKLLRDSGCYFVFITRHGTGKLTYAISSLCYLKLVHNGKYRTNVLCTRYNETYTPVRPDIVITEDLKSGFAIINEVLNCEVKSAGGRSNVKNIIESVLRNNSTVYCIVDGAAFGSDMEAVNNLCNNYDVYVFAPESFEYMILMTSYFKRFISDELSATYKYADSSEFLTWEQYYTFLLRKLCNDNFKGVSYNKEGWDRLNPFFKRVNFLKQIVLMLEDLSDVSIKDNYKLSE